MADVDLCVNVNQPLLDVYQMRSADCFACGSHDVSNVIRTTGIDKEN